jgi:signal transduction histidine kinase
LSLFSFIILGYFSKDISQDINVIVDSLNKIASHENIEYDKKLPVTSNDELGDLVVAFNKILDLEKRNISTIEKNQEILLEQERLSSLGQLIGGIAHNLKTPIMSIAGALEGLTDLIKEYDESIEDNNVTNEDHHAIARDMRVWVDKIRPYLSYMTEVIDTVKGQAVSMNASTMKHFNAKELLSRIKILLRDELKRKNCTLNMDLQVDENSFVTGEISALIQVIDNLIINAIDSYRGNPGNIDLKVYEDENKIYIEVKDYGCGIPEHVKERLFKEMITSKGKNGTGLGLYMSYSTVKGKFNGDMKYESEEGKGTTFFIELNKERG